MESTKPKETKKRRSKSADVVSNVSNPTTPDTKMSGSSTEDASGSFGVGMSAASKVETSTMGDDSSENSTTDIAIKLPESNSKDQLGGLSTPSSKEDEGTITSRLSEIFGTDLELTPKEKRINPSPAAYMDHIEIEDFDDAFLHTSAIEGSAEQVNIGGSASSTSSDALPETIKMIPSDDLFPHLNEHTKPYTKNTAGTDAQESAEGEHSVTPSPLSDNADTKQKVDVDYTFLFGDDDGSLFKKCDAPLSPKTKKTVTIVNHGSTESKQESTSPVNSAKAPTEQERDDSEHDEKQSTTSSEASYMDKTDVSSYFFIEMMCSDAAKTVGAVLLILGIVALLIGTLGVGLVGVAAAGLVIGGGVGAAIGVTSLITSGISHSFFKPNGDASQLTKVNSDDSLHSMRSEVTTSSL